MPSQYLKAVAIALTYFSRLQETCHSPKHALTAAAEGHSDGRMEGKSLGPTLGVDVGEKLTEGAFVG